MVLRIFERKKDVIYVIARILIGLLFAQHGAQKLFGWFGGSAQPLMSQMGIAGIIELIGGLAIALGFFTRLAALGCVLVMLVAYFKVHAPQGLIPIENKGELALLYFSAFLFILSIGAGKFSLEKALFKKELF